MNRDLCLLVHVGTLRVAVRIRNGMDRDLTNEEIHARMPLHVRNVGPIERVDHIFAVVEVPAEDAPA